MCRAITTSRPAPAEPILYRHSNNAYEVPAALMSDALTILSANWKDSQGYATYSSSVQHL